MIVWDFYEAVTDVEDTGSISAESNEGVAEHAIGDASFSVFSIASGVPSLPCLLIIRPSTI